MSLDLDITYIFVLAMLLLPLMILNGLVIGPFLRLFEERHERLEGAVARAEEMLEQAERRAATFEDKIREATQRGLELRSRIRKETDEAMATFVSDARSKAQSELAEALTRLGKDTEQALHQVDGHAQAMAELTAAKLLGRKVA